MLTGPVADLIERTQQRIDELPVELEGRRAFMAAYLRTTETVGAAIEEARFEDPQCGPVRLEYSRVADGPTHRR